MDHAFTEQLAEAQQFRSVAAARRTLILTPLVRHTGRPHLFLGAGSYTSALIV
jgi:hypothetical protein